jgi:hypothetical protein
MAQIAQCLGTSDDACAKQLPRIRPKNPNLQPASPAVLELAVLHTLASIFPGMEDERQKIVAARLQRLDLLEPLLALLPETLRASLQEEPLDKYAEKLAFREHSEWTKEKNALGSVLENIGLSWGQIAKFLEVKRTTYKEHFRMLKNPPDPKSPDVRATAVGYFGALPFERQTKLFFSLSPNQREALLALLPEALQGSLRANQTKPQNESTDDDDESEDELPSSSVARSYSNEFVKVIYDDDESTDKKVRSRPGDESLFFCI